MSRGAACSCPVRDDHVLALTRWVARLVIPFLLGAFLVLWGTPDRTTAFFAWTIHPTMTPIVMGAGYGAGVYFFYRVATADAWHRVAPVFVGITAFTWFMAAATALHWGNFNHAHPTFPIWVVLYAVTPVLVPVVWWRNRRTDPVERAPGDPRLPRGVQYVGGAVGVVITLGAVAAFLDPSLLIDAWPWTLSPFTAQIVAGWLGLFGVAHCVVPFEPRWSSYRVLVQSEWLGFAFILVGVARAWADFDPSNPLTWGFVGGLLVYAAAVGYLYYRMEAAEAGASSRPGAAERPPG